MTSPRSSDLSWVGAWTPEFNKFPRWEVVNFRAKVGKHKIKLEQFMVLKIKEMLKNREDLVGRT